MSQDLTFEALCKTGNRELMRLLRQGTPPALSDLVGYEFRGYNTNPATELLRIRKFKKGFAEDPHDPDALAGYNVTVRQNGLVSPWLPRMRRGEPHRHSLFAVRPLRPGEPAKHPNALLLDYKLPGKLPADPSWLLTDYLVQISPENPDLLLGVGYGAVGPVFVFGSFFIAERYNPIL
jgi:hypothetical protein